MPINAPSLMTNPLNLLNLLITQPNLISYILEWTISGNFTMMGKCRLI